MVPAEAARSKGGGGSLRRRRDAMGKAEALLVREQDESVSVVCVATVVCVCPTGVIFY